MKNFELELVAYSHSIGETGVHLQFTPAYRRPIFNIPKVKDLVKLYIKSKAKTMNIIIAGIGIGPDHIHLFICNFKNYSISEIVRRLKGYVSRMMRKHHKKLFKHYLWGKKFWSSGYFHRTVGAVTSDTMEFYVKHSQKRHWKSVDYEYYKHSKEKQENLMDFFN